MSIHLSRLPAQLAVADFVAPPSTLVELLLWRATGRPDQLAYTFLTDGETNADLITYGELDRRARTIGALLQQAGAAGERALLLYPPGIEYIAAFFGCLYAGVTAVPAYPPNPSKIQRTLPRLQTIVNDAQPKVALTTAEILPMAEAMAMIAPDFQRMRWLATDAPVADLAPWEAPELTGRTLAMLQYTSGSTSTPKGVMLSHSNLLHNLGLIHSCFGHDSGSAGVIWLPPYHDMGLIGGILQPLYGAFPVTLMSPVAFLQRPLRWLEAITRARATTSGGPNFAYDLCVRKITPEQRATLDLSSWRVAFNGAEPIQAETMNRFAEAFGPCGFRRDAFLPCYGLAEATLIVSGKAHDARPIERVFQGAALEQHQALTTDGADPAGRRLVGCGPAMADLDIAIVHQETRVRSEPGGIGEIWVSGPSIAQGYWGQPEVSQQTFGARPAGEAGGPFLRTGDLGFMQDGELFVTGRIKDLLIIRGRNHYPHDIELTVERCHPALRPGCGAAFTVEVDSEERLVIAQEIERQFRTVDIDEVAAAVRRAVAEQHELHVYAIALLKTGAIPKTSSGKIQRRATRAEYLEGTLSLVGSSLLEEAAPDTAEQPTREELLATAPEARGALLEAYVRAEIAQVLRVAPAAIDPGQPLSDLGLDSLMAVDLQHRLESGLGIVVPMTSFLEGVSIAQLAEGALAQLAATTESPRPSSAPAAEAGQAEHPLSYGQRAMWFLHQLAPESAAYNIAGAVRIAPALDIAALRRAFQRLVDRHPVLRTTFPLRAGEPVQVVHPHGEPLFAIEQAAGWSEAELNKRLTEAAHRPFDLEHGPLLRVHLFTRAGEEHILLLVMHHIISDLWSLAILVQELGRLYPAEQAGAPLALDPLPIQYADYARRQAERLAGPMGQRDWAYWQDMLSGELPVLNLPTDRPRPPIQTYHGASQAIQLGPELTGALKARAQERRATLYMVLVAAFHALLYRYTGQDDLIIGSTTAGRQQAELAGVAGYFVNPIALRAKFPAGITFEALLDQVRRTVLGALEHADYPLALAIERLQPVRDLSRSPLFQAMFILQKAPTLGTGGLEALALGAQGQRIDLAGLRLESLTLDHRISQFDLTLTLGEAGGRLIGTFEYNTDLFDPATVARWTGHFERLLAGIAADPRRPIAQVPLLTTAEQQQFAAWNATNATDPQVASLIALFERQVERTPEATAVLLPAAAERGEAGRSLTYRELNQRANQLARHLRKLGVGPEVCAGLCLDRSLELVVAILGVLKAGGAYLPLDPDYPAERMAFMLQEARAAVLITTTDDRRPTTDQAEDRGWRMEDSSLDASEKPSSIFYPPSSRGSVVGGRWSVVDLVADWPVIANEPDTNPASDLHPENLACVIYTSGSTGQPKGVLLEHRNLINLVCSFIESYAPGENDRLLPLTAIASASFVGEVLPVLCSGGALVLPDKDEFLDFQQLIALIAREGVSILSTVPAFLSGINALAGQLPRLRLMLSGGEALFANQVDQLLDSATVVNGYGLTETTVCSTCYQVGHDDLRSDVPIPIGPPLRNTRIAVLDQHGQPAPIGMPGELYIAGAGVVRGYLNDPALTAERFVPFSTTTDDRRPTTDGAEDRGWKIEDGSLDASEKRSSILYSPSSSRVGGQWSVVGGRELTRPSLALPALFAINYALARVWMAWGIRPDAMIGHSLGEYVAACLAGVLTLDDALALVALRGRLFEQLPPGAMLSVHLSEQGILPLLNPQLSLAALNGPAQCVVAGPLGSIEHLAGELARRGVSHRPIPIDVAAHSAMLAPILEPFTRFVASLDLRAPTIPYVSNVTGGWITAEQATDPHYWTRHLRETVRFSAGITTLARDPGCLFIEVGPGRALCTFVKQTLGPSAGRSVFTSLPHPTDSRPDDAFLLLVLGQLWMAGTPIDWSRLYPHERRRRVPLPAYPFERRRHWLDASPEHRYVGPAPRPIEQTDSAAAQDSTPPAGVDDAPHHDNERILAGIWQDVLGVNPVGIHDNFFALGGDSLLAVHLLARIRDALRVDLPPHSLLQSPTIADLAVQCGRARESAVVETPPHPALVVLQASGTRRPLFLVHPAGGGVYIYRELAGLLGPDQPIYGLHAHDSAELPTPRVETIAAEYRAAITTVQPSGPYLLGGSSFGGVVAFEIAQQLQARGEEVELLALIDTAHPYQLQAWMVAEDAILMQVLGVESAELPPRPAGQEPDAHLHTCLELAQTSGRIPPDFGLDEFRHYLGRLAGHLRAMREYRPRIYPGSIVFFRASERDPFNPPAPEQGWKTIAAGGVELYDIPGNHTTINHTPNVEVLAAYLSRHLAQVDQPIPLVSA